MSDCGQGGVRLDRIAILRYSISLMLVVQKYGGHLGWDRSSASATSRGGVWPRSAEGHQVVVIVSAMSGETNRLLALAPRVSPEPDERELDVIAATGEQVSVGAACAGDAGRRAAAAQSFLGTRSAS